MQSCGLWNNFFLSLRSGENEVTQIFSQRILFNSFSLR